MDHGYEHKIGLFLIVVDSYSGWPEVVRVSNRSAENVTHVVRTIFARNGVPKTLVSDNAREFCDESMCKWLRKIGCNPMKTPPFHPQSNGVAERMVATIKLGLKAYSPQFGSVDAYLQRMLLSYRSIPHGDRNSSPSLLMGRQIRAPLTMAYHTGSPLWYRATSTSPPERERATFLNQAGHNTAVIVRRDRGVLTHADQINKVPPSPTASESQKDHNQETLTESKRDRNVWTDLLCKLPGNVEVEDEEEDGERDNTGEEVSDAEVRRSSRTNLGMKPNRFQ